MDRDRFDGLLLDHLAAAQRFAIRLCGDAHCAEDLLHDAIVRAVGGCDGFREEAKFTTWLFQIIVNCFRDRLRRPAVKILDEEIADVRPANRADSESEEIACIVAAHVSSLPPRQREVIVLIAYEQMSAPEAAEILGISEQNVRTNLSYARQNLKRSLAAFL